MKRLLPLLLLAISALSLAACGAGESEEDKIAAVIEKAATSTDPAVCEETQTAAFIEQTSSGEGKDAVRSCEEEAEEGKNNPESVDVSRVKAEGQRATAVVSFTGGSFDGQTLDVSLVEEGGRWKLDRAERFEHLDRGKLIESFEASFEESGVAPALSDCIVERVEGFGDGQLEQLVLGGDQGITEVVEGCSRQ